MNPLSRACIFFALLAPNLALAQTFQGKPFLSVQGHAEAKVRPDVFPLTLTLKQTSTDAAKSQALIEGLARSLLKTVADLHVADSDISVGNLSISPETKYDNDHEREVFLGNTYEREIRVRFHSLDDVRSLIAAVPDSKNVQIDTGTFEYSGKQALERKLRIDAVADARQAAAEMSNAVGKRLGQLYNVSDRAQSTIYSSSGYSESDALDTIVVTGTRIRRSAEIVLREGEIRVAADAFLVYLIAD